MLKWSLFLASLVFLTSRQEVVGIRCAQCSYFPDYFNHLKDEASIKTINVLGSNSALTEQDKKTVQSFQMAISNNTSECYQDPHKFTRECPDEEYNTCIKQTVSLKSSQKDPAVIYSCATWGKDGCHKEEDESSVLTICGCKTDLCNVERKKYSVETTHVTIQPMISTTGEPEIRTTEEPPSKKDPNAVGLISALIGLIIAGVKLSSVCCIL